VSNSTPLKFGLFNCSHNPISPEYSDRPYVFYFFTTALFLKAILANRTVKHIWYFPTHPRQNSGYLHYWTMKF
jgi:hypothetical protein